jgi:hypothetical protein
MSNPWFNIRSDLFRHVEIATLKPKQFRKRMLAALAGEVNEFTPFIRGPFDRPLSHEWALLRAAVFERDDYTCQYCGERGGRLECDHIHPVARGGGSEMNNLATSCFRCNRSKRSKTLQEWVR